MKGDIRILEGSLLLLADQAEDWDGYEQIAVVGAYRGHWQGEFEITEAMLQQMAKFGNTKKIKTPCDYGHEMVFNNAAPASGWISPGNFEVRGEGKKAALFAKVEWNEAARQQIAAKELLYKSPTIIFNTVDRKTGRTGGSSIHSVALTNTPFLHELPEVRLNSIMGAIESSKEQDRLSGDPASEENKMEETTRIALAAALGLAENATLEQIMAAAKKPGPTLAPLATALGLADNATEADITASIRELRAKASSADALADRVKVLEEQNARRAELDRKASALSAVKQAQAEGKILGDETDNFKQWLALAEGNLEQFQTIAASLPVIAPLSDPVKPRPGSNNNTVAMTPQQKKYAAQLGLSDEDWAAHANHGQD